MRCLGPVETGMLKGHASVWLCTRDGCGHESECIDSLIEFVENGRTRILERARDRWRARLLELMRKRSIYSETTPLSRAPSTLG